MVLVGALRGIPLLSRTSIELVVHPDPFDDQHAVLDLDVALGL